VREDKLQVVHHEDLHFNDSGDRVAQFLWLRSRRNPDRRGGERRRQYRSWGSTEMIESTRTYSFRMTRPPASSAYARHEPGTSFTVTANAAFNALSANALPSPRAVNQATSMRRFCLLLLSLCILRRAFKA